ncbi:MAG: hypothetical protein WBV22_09755, partial [Anaerolineaceae bacterium]
ALYYIIALVVSIVVILLSLFNLIMTLIRFGKGKNSSDLQIQKASTKRLISGIFSTVVLFVVGIALVFVVLYYMA